MRRAAHLHDAGEGVLGADPPGGGGGGVWKNAKPHQLAAGEDGLTVLARSVSEHNLLSASKLYNNITVEQLGQLLGVGSDIAEETAAKMISEERMKGSIDQVEGMIISRTRKTTRP